MATNKTAETDKSVEKFIETFVEQEQKKVDSYHLLKLMNSWSGHKPKMWGPSIIGFGSYHYQYKSGHEGHAPLIGFSPRKAKFSFYIYSPTEISIRLLERLGKFKMGKSCIYVNKLADVDINVLEQLCLETIKYLEEHEECACRH